MGNLLNSHIWAWVYNSATTIRQGAKKGTNATVVKTKLSFNWIGPSKILAAGPVSASAIPDGRAFHDKLLYFDFPSDMPEHDCKRRVSVLRCKPCRNPDDIRDLHKHLPADLTKYVLNSFTKRPVHVTVDISPPPESFEVDQITGHQHVGVITVMYETHWVGLRSPLWEHERGLQHHRLHILRYWSGSPSQHRQTDRLYRQMRTGAAHCELSRSRDEIFLAPGYSFVPRTSGFAASALQLFRPGHNSGTRPAMASGGWAKLPIAADNSSAHSYVVRFHDPGPIKIDLSSSFYITSRNTVQGS